MAHIGAQMYEGLTRRFVQYGSKGLKLAALDAVRSTSHPLWRGKLYRAG
jgi:hypothetical protein